jgi:hypothetical protein
VPRPVVGSMVGSSIPQPTLDNGSNETNSALSARSATVVDGGVMFRWTAGLPTTRGYATQRTAKHPAVDSAQASDTLDLSPGQTSHEMYPHVLA